MTRMAILVGGALARQRSLNHTELCLILPFFAGCPLSVTGSR